MLDSNTDFYGGEREWSDLSDESNLSDKTHTASERDEISGKREQDPAQVSSAVGFGSSFPEHCPQSAQPLQISRLPHSMQCFP